MLAGLLFALKTLHSGWPKNCPLYITSLSSLWKYLFNVVGFILSYVIRKCSVAHGRVLKNEFAV